MGRSAQQSARPAHYLARSSSGRPYRSGTSMATRTGQGAVRAAADGWATEWGGQELPGRIEGRLVGTASLYVSRDGHDAEWVVLCATGIGKIARAYALACAKATGDAPLEQDLVDATFAGLELIVQGKRWRLVRDALTLAGTEDSNVAAAYKVVVRRANGKPAPGVVDPAVSALARVTADIEDRMAAGITRDGGMYLTLHGERVLVSEDVYRGFWSRVMDVTDADAVRRATRHIELVTGAPAGW